MRQPNFSALIEQFVQHGTFVRGWTPDTVRTYRYSLREPPAEISKGSLNDRVVALRHRGLSPDGINLRIRSINSFLTWLHEEGHVGERHRIKLLRNPPKPIDVLNDQDIERLMTHRPDGKVETRIWTLAVLLLDSGRNGARMERNHATKTSGTSAGGSASRVAFIHMPSGAPSPSTRRGTGWMSTACSASSAIRAGRSRAVQSFRQRHRR